METKQIALAEIRIDGDTQIRARIDLKLVDEYADLYRDEQDLGALDVFWDGTLYWLANGFHRWHAAEAAVRTELPCRIHSGTREDAQWFACGANRTNGRRLANADKQNAVERSLLHPNGARLSDREIAAHAGVSSRTVGKYRAKLEASREISKMAQRIVRRGDQIYEQNTANIGDAVGQQGPEEQLESVTGDVNDGDMAASPQQNNGGQGVSQLADGDWQELEVLLGRLVKTAGKKTATELVRRLLIRLDLVGAVSVRFE